MIISKNLFQQKFLAPKEIENVPTTKLLENGTFCFYHEPGFPTFMPLGKKVADKIQNVLTEESEKADIPVIEIPFTLKDEILEKGEKLGDIFKSKIFYLEGEMKGSHMMTTPEPFMIELATKALETYSQLPILYTYPVEVFRALPRPEGLLKGRQFKTFMGNSFDETEESLLSSRARFEHMTDSIFRRLGIQTQKVRKKEGFNLEYFYRCPEGDNLDLPLHPLDPANTDIQNNLESRVQALSLAMVYHYCPNQTLWARFRNKNNKNSRVLYNTYGLGTQRVFYALFDNSRDKNGFNLPTEFSPYDLTVAPLTNSQLEESGKVYHQLKQLGISAVWDDREKITVGEKLRFSDFIGVPYKALVTPTVITIKDREGNCTVANNPKEVQNVLNNRTKLSTELVI
jgi:prolyl-tRNA synthetase